MSGRTPQPGPHSHDAQRPRIRRRLRIGGIALLAGGAIVLVLPLTSFGLGLHGALSGVLKVVPQVTSAVQGAVHHVTAPSGPSGGSSSGGGSGQARHTESAPAAAAPRATSPPDTPAMYGTNPHGQGTVGSVALTPSAGRPYTYNPGGSGGEIAVLGRGRSEQNGSSSHAHTTILALLGQEILGVDAQPGESHKGPLDAIQTGILDSICKGTGMLACLTVLEADTVASSGGASTLFSVAHATIAGPNGIDVGVAESNSKISSNSKCQTASGSSTAANVNIGGGTLASVGKSSESSSACAGQAPSQQASSSVIGLGGSGVPLPLPGCANGTPNTKLSVLGLASAICNADDTAQAAAPAGVRESLTAIVLPSTGSSLAKTAVSASESHAVAPSASSCTGTGCGGKGGNNGNGNGNGSGSGTAVGGQNTGTGEGGGEAGNETGSGELGSGSGENGSGSGESGATAAAGSSGSLPFTGENVLEVVLVGLLLAATGLGLGLRTKESH